MARLFRYARCYCTAAPAGGMAVSVTDERVQSLILRMTGVDFNRVFQRRRESLERPEYRLLSFEEIQEVHSETLEKAKKLVKMTPVLPKRKEKNEILEEDSRLNNFDDSKWVFIDITMRVPNKDRRIVVREPNGTLRGASWEQRDRLCQLYFPQPWRKIQMPSMLTKEGLPSVLAMNRHVAVLDQVCLQCEPDSSDYIRVHHAVYEDVAKKSAYNALRSTQHFGGLVWYLMERGWVEHLLADMVSRKLEEDATSLVELHLLCYPQSSFASELPETQPRDMDMVKMFSEHFKFPIDFTSTSEKDSESQDSKTQDSNQQQGEIAL